MNKKLKIAGISAIASIPVLGATAGMVAALINYEAPTRSFVTSTINAPFFKTLENTCFNKQLTVNDLWSEFEHVFIDCEDTQVEPGTPNWRGEFWGKMMRGGVLCYKYSKNEQIYNCLEQSVTHLIDNQEDNGRISTYAIGDKEFTAWDMWGRKYVMTGMLHFYEICKDESLKQRIITSLERQADYILDNVGPGKRDITHTGYDQWHGINSSTILEPMVNLYEVTKEKKYLDFATYIINTGGIFDGNMIECAKANIDPIDFPVRKAYESMSFFEGVYRYGKVVGDRSLIKAALNYFDKVAQEEITVIGSGGYEEEQWHAGNISQTSSHTGQGWPLRWGNETCVTVTWMRILNILYEETHDIKYYEQFETAALNAFLGTLNVKEQPIAGVDDDNPFPFDTYSPICCEPRGINGGGVVEFQWDGAKFKHYGCCQCNAPASVGLMGLNAIRPLSDKWFINEYYQGQYASDDTTITIPENNFEVNGQALMNIESKSNEQLMLRIPSWSNDPKVIVNNKEFNVTPGKYFRAGTLKDIKTVQVSFNPEVELKRIHDKVYFTFGPYVLAFDQYHNKFLQDEEIDKMRDIQIRDLDVESMTLQEDVDPNEIVRFRISYKDGSNQILLTNYSSAGRDAYYETSKTTRMVNVFIKCDFPEKN